MCDEWMPQLELPLNREQFHQLPRNPAYKYELIGGKVFLTPRPKHFHAVLDLPHYAPEPLEPSEKVTIRPLVEDDWPKLGAPFRASMSRVQPFASLDTRTLEVATRESLERTRTGGDGPLLSNCCFVADAEREGPAGAILITLVPGGDPSEWDSYCWSGPAPPDVAAQRAAQPHLTWIFVPPLRTGLGIGSALLAAAVQALQANGYTQLWSTFLNGNDMSLLWHWRNGFRLLPYPGSRRRMMRLFRARTT